MQHPFYYLLLLTLKTAKSARPLTLQEQFSLSGRYAVKLVCIAEKLHQI